MLDEEELAALGALYKATGGVGSLLWRKHQFVFRRPSVDEWDNYTRGRRTDQSGAPDRQIVQILLVSMDGETNVTRARQTLGAFLSSGNAAFPNSPKVNALLTELAGAAEEEEAANMGEGVGLWNGIHDALPAASPNGSHTAPVEPISPGMAAQRRS